MDQKFLIVETNYLHLCLFLENLNQKNRVTNMVNSGSKGKPTNIAQIVACLGQQNVESKCDNPI